MAASRDPPGWMAWLDSGGSRIAARCAGVTPGRDSFVTGGYLRPARSWVLPLWDERATGPPPDLDAVFAGLAHDEKVLIRSTARPLRQTVRNNGWAMVEALRAGREPGGRGLSRSLGRWIGDGLRELLAFAVAAQSYRPRSHQVTRQRLAEAGAAEAKVRGPLVALELHLLVRARNRRRARKRLRQAAAAFSHGAGPFNRLVLRRPQRRGSYVRTIRTARPWRGAEFVASAAEAAALSGRPLGEFTGLAEQRTWTRRTARRGRVTHDAALFLGQALDE